jgi:hypothetical protein
MNSDPKNTRVEPVVNAVSVSTPQTEGEKIWSEIKDKEINMFSLPSQRVSDCCSPVLIDPSRCFLLFRASATLPALETAIGNKYECNIEHKYIVVSRNTKLFGTP